MYPASTPCVGVPAAGRCASMTHSPSCRCSSSTPPYPLIVPSCEGRSATIPVANRREGAECTPPRVIASAHARYTSMSLPAEYRSQAPTPGGRHPISENFSPLGPKNPLHVRGRRPDAERGDDPLPHLTQFPVLRCAVDAVGGDELRRDPPGPHRLEHVRVVVRGEVHSHLAVDRDRVVEPLVALDELLDCDRRGALAAEHAEGLVELGVGVHPDSPRRPRPAARLEDQ